MLKAPIVLPNGKIEYPKTGTPQGGILSPILSNIVLNEMDWWIASQWENIPTRWPYKCGNSESGQTYNGNKYTPLRQSKLKEMFIVRYADDFKIFCRKRSDANKTFAAVNLWLQDRLKLQISEEKSKVVNLKNNYSEFLGFKLKAVKKGKKYVVKAHVSDKALRLKADSLKRQAIKMTRPKNQEDEYLSINQYNAMVVGIHNYFQIATDVSGDFGKIAKDLNTVMKNRLRGRLSKSSGCSRDHYILRRYGASKQIRFIGQKPIAPIGYIKSRYPVWKKKSICKYTESGRLEVHAALGMDTHILYRLMGSKDVSRSIEYMDNRISLYVAQKGKCAVSGLKLALEDIHCHHKVPVNLSGTDKYSNLAVVHADIHRLIHATNAATIQKYMDKLSLSKSQLANLNKLRRQANLAEIA